ncbi:hypothetical protein SAMN02745121_07566 [Nannocystis exedens]|uniref:Uncharacterized protein n=1 Tax=Nannocystis exedens TaxID=54 RepID=A0A1I2GZQ9_9BACT|nr:hypothetical protein [Nannocystis exedens]PCC68904.1 hypothetical protein NAEX_01925 [Nannocystis exedens]SFF22056.1 hypothetical protein SAMN02745121_07566 [Nannocystis exedens]
MTTAKSSQWTTFQTPACQVDFPDAALQNRMNQLWNTNLSGFTRQGITGNPWTATNSSDQTWYFDPTTTDISEGQYAQIVWSPVPGRIKYYFPNTSNPDMWSLADTGYDTKGRTFGQIPADPCDPSDTTKKPYGPYGPRGWQDEYCEWSITRNAQGQIVRIDFTCENPEYWNTLWMVSPQRVVELYRSTLDKPQIALEDLYLRDASGNPVIDASTGRPAYDPLNKWNRGTASTADAGGAMHLTSTPNTLQTEIGLGSTATTPRTSGNANPSTLICCAQYGQIGRNSDPHIGQSVNLVVTPPNPAISPAKATLANPPGLYIQTPNFNRITAPGGVDPRTFWTVKRGQQSLTDPAGNQLPGNFILHAVFEVPRSFGFTISDLQVDGVQVQWAAQIAQTFNMQIAAMALPQKPGPAVQACAGSPAVSQAQALQLFNTPVFEAMIATPVANPVGQPMNLASNSTMIAPHIEPGARRRSLTLVLTGLLDPPQIPNVSFGAGVHVLAAGPMRAVTYAIPGNTYPSTSYALDLHVSVDDDAAPGLRDALVSNPGQTATIAMPALLNVVDPVTKDMV